MDFGQFDFTVTPDVRRLAEEVEGLFQRDLSIHRHSPDCEAYNYIGGARISSHDVGISLGRGFGLYSLAHELCHLRRYARGIPRLASDDETEEWAWRVEQPLEHLAIYPELAGMDVGVNPYANPKDWELFRQKFPERIERAAREKDWSSMQCLASAVWKVELGTTDEYLKEWLREAVNVTMPEALALGKRMADAVSRIDLVTPDGKIEAMRTLKRLLRIHEEYSVVQFLIIPPPSPYWFHAHEIAMI